MKKNEIEVKYQIDLKEKPELVKKLISAGFKFSRDHKLTDAFLEMEKTDKGWNFIRIRKSGSEYFKTTKSWEIVNGVKCRIEDEKKISVKEFEKLLKTAKLSYQKVREEYKREAVTICFDTIGEDCFVEAETFGAVENTEDIKQLLKLILKSFGIDTTTQAKGMLDYILEKNYGKTKNSK